MTESFIILSFISARVESSRAVLRSIGIGSSKHVQSLVEEIKDVISDILVGVKESRYASGRQELAVIIMWSSWI